jgi:hypothetical protein
LLTSVLGAKKDEITGAARKLHNDGHCNLYTSRNVIRIIQPRRMRWARGKRGIHLGFWWESQKETGH